MKCISSGIVCLTDRNLYYSSPEKSLKIPYSKIINLEPYENGLGLQMNEASSMPIFLEGVSSWSCYNLISNLN